MLTADWEVEGSLIRKGYSVHFSAGKKGELDERTSIPEEGGKVHLHLS